MSKRKYEETHPWLTFELRLDKLSHKTWILLGEAQSKCEHIAGVPLLPEVAQELHRLYLAKGALSTTAIEGNTLTEGQVLEHLDGKLILPPSQEYLAREIQNILDTCNQLMPTVIDGTLSIMDVNLIKSINRMVLDGLPIGEGVVPGKIRSHSVTVGRYRGTPPEDCEFLLERLCGVLNQFATDDYPPVVVGLIKAIFAHLYLAWIHPFGDGNGRTSRLVEFLLLLNAGVSTPAAHLLSNYYNQTRSEYYRQLDYASKSGGNPTSFMAYAIRGFIEGLKGQLSKIREHQLDLTWQYFVYEHFKEREHMNAADRRRRDLLIDLSTVQQPTLLREVPTITARTAKAYAKLKDRSLSRDLQLLLQEGLIEIEGGKIRPRKELIKSFLPDSKSVLMRDTNLVKRKAESR